MDTYKHIHSCTNEGIVLKGSLKQAYKIYLKTPKNTNHIIKHHFNSGPTFHIKTAQPYSWIGRDMQIYRDRLTQAHVCIHT